MFSPAFFLLPSKISGHDMEIDKNATEIDFDDASHEGINRPASTQPGLKQPRGLFGLRQDVVEEEVEGLNERRVLSAYDILQQRKVEKLQRRRSHSAPQNRRSCLAPRFDNLAMINTILEK